MFEMDEVAEMAEWDAAETLAAAARARSAENDAARDHLQLAVHYADLHPSPTRIPDDQRLPKGQRGWERGVAYGGPGCPAVAEFAVAEYGVVLGISMESAAKDIGQALALRHRLPLIWVDVMAGEATPWKARLIATACLELSVEAAAIVDRRVAGLVDSVSPHQLRNIVKAAIWEADPEAARAEAERKARERGVWIGRSDEHGTTTMFIKAATGSVIRLYATINQTADALAALGDTDSLRQRQARAVDVLSDPALADKLLQVAQYLATHPAADATEEDAAAPAEPTDAGTAAATSDSPGFTGAGAAAAAEPTATAAATSDSPGFTGSGADPAAAPTDQDAAPTGAARTNDARAHSDQAQPDQEPRTNDPAAEPSGTSLSTDAIEPEVTSDGEPASDLFLTDEPGTHTEADRDTPHPSHPAHPLDPSPPSRPPGPAESAELRDHAATLAATLTTGVGAAARHDLATKLAAIKHAADLGTTGVGTTGRRPGRTKLYIHLTDETLLAGGGTTRVEGFGPVYAPKLAELLGHDRIIVQPVIDLNEHINVNAYEIPQRLRERIKLTYPVEQFPYGPGETTNSTDLDHITPYDPTGPPGQTSTTNLQPLRRFGHRVKTHAPGWIVRRIDDHTVEWTTRHGYKVRVDHTGTHPWP